MEAGGGEGRACIPVCIVYCPRGRHGYPAQLPHVLQPPHTGLAVPEPRRPAEARGGWAGQVGGAGCGVTCVQCGGGVMWPAAGAGGGRWWRPGPGGCCRWHQAQPSTSLTSTIDQCGAEVRLARSEQLIHHTVNRLLAEPLSCSSTCLS